MRAIIVATALISLCCAASAQTPAPPAQTNFARVPLPEDRFAYIRSDALWSFPAGQEMVIFVCWEHINSVSAADQQLARDAVTRSWQANSGVVFRDWGQCREYTGAHTPDNVIRIAEARAGAGTWGLGVNLDDQLHGMEIDFDNWRNYVCQEGATREQCLSFVVTHEFGHALGFAHEHNREDRPDDCTADAQGSDGDVRLTEYDPNSIMNYCASVSGLSPLDIIAVQKLYCRPGARNCRPDLS